MSVTIESTTDTTEQVNAALGLKAQKEETKTPMTEKSETKETEKSASEKSDEKELSNSEIDTSESDETDEIEGDDDESTSDDEVKAKKKPRGFKRRIDKLRSTISQKDQELAYWREQALKSQQQKPEVEGQKKEFSEQVNQEDGRPSPDNFETIAEYIDALDDWKADQRERKVKEQELKTEHQKKLEAHLKRVEAFAERQEDFDDVIGDVEDVMVPFAIQKLILETEKGPEIFYELAKQGRDEFERTMRLDALSAARKIGMLEAKLSQSTEVKQEEAQNVKITKAPAPLKTLGNKSTGLSTKSPDEMDFREYKKWREANT